MNSNQENIDPTNSNISLRNNNVFDTNNNTEQKPVKKGPYGLTGIVNTTNTCYMNSALQALSHNYPLTSYLFGKKTEILEILKKNAPKIFKDNPAFKLDCQDSIVPMGLREKINNPNYTSAMLTNEEASFVFNNTITFQLIKLLEIMWTRNSIVIPTSFRKVFSEARDKFFFGYEQHDAEEAYSCILQKMQEELAENIKIRFKTTKSVEDFLNFKNNMAEKIKSTSDPLIKTELYEMYMKKKREMPVESLTVEAFREMKKYYEMGYSSVTEMFSGFLHSCMKCPNESCGYSSNKFDPFLHLSLEIPSTSSFNTHQSVMIEDCIKDFCKEEALDEKNLWNCEGCNNKVRGVKSLRLWQAPQVLVIQLKRFKQFGSGRVVKENIMVRYPLEHFDISSMISPTQVESSKCTKYRLQCVINHTGGRDGGHYYAYCLDEDTNDWYEYNDMKVSRIPLTRIVTSTAYLLFYIRQDLIKTNTSN